MDGLSFDDVVVVKHEYAVTRVGSKGIEECSQNGLDGCWWQRIEHDEGFLPNTCLYGLQGCNEVTPEKRRVIVPFVKRNPCHRQRVSSCRRLPFTQQCRFTEAGRRRNERKLVIHARVQPLNQL